MCGIYFSFDYDSSLEKNNWKNIQHRGPDNSISLLYDSHFFGFHRLALQDTSNRGDQPFFIQDIILLCNGEIYNHKQLKKKYQIETIGNSDCEIILHLYKKIGIELLLKEISGYYAFILFDTIKKTYFIARDPNGLRPLYFGKKKTNHQYIFCSEIKGLYSSCFPESIQIFPSGYFLTNNNSFISFHDYFPIPVEPFRSSSLSELHDKFYYLFINAVQKRLTMERDFGVLLSGGLDSSLIAAVIQSISEKPIKTFSIGLKNSPDLIHAKKVATFIQSDHTEVIVSEEEMLNSMEQVIYHLETFDITTIRASIPMFLLSKYISEHTDIKVIFSGEGSDEISGGYLYFHQYPSEYEFHMECCRLVKDLCFFDSLRSDKSTSGNGLEVRCPFLDKELVQFYLTLPIKYRVPHNRIEKWFIRKSFEDKLLLPHDILWRKKEAFSDGVSTPQNSWFQIIQNFLQTTKTSLSEKEHYKNIFLKFFPGCYTISPYYWMPKWNNHVSDPSARLL